jgi:hypothetical protein
MFLSTLINVIIFVYLSVAVGSGLSSFTSDLFLALCPVTICLSAIPLTFCVSYQMFLTSHIRTHVCPYISENNFGSSKQIIVPTGYSTMDHIGLRFMSVTGKSLSRGPGSPKINCIQIFKLLI